MIFFFFFFYQRSRERWTESREVGLSLRGPQQVGPQRIRACQWREYRAGNKRTCLLVQPPRYFSILALCKFHGAAVTKSHKLCGLHNRNLLSHSPGGWELQIKVCTGWILLSAMKENVTFLSPNFCLFTWSWVFLPL